MLIRDGVSELEVNRAAALINRCEGAVTLEGVATLICGAGEIRCEIVAPASAMARCEEEYKVLVENAAHALRSSRLVSHLPDWRLQWVVVDGAGDDAVELWREP